MKQKKCWEAKTLSTQIKENQKIKHHDLLSRSRERESKKKPWNSGWIAPVPIIYHETLDHSHIHGTHGAIPPELNRFFFTFRQYFLATKNQETEPN